MECEVERRMKWDEEWNEVRNGMECGMSGEWNGMCASLGNDDDVISVAQCDAISVGFGGAVVSTSALHL